MKQEYKNRIWKHFLEQKAYEVLNVIGYLLVGYMLIVGLPLALGLNIGDGFSELCGDSWRIPEECDLLVSWFEGVFYLIIVGLISWGIVKWFESNWWDATWEVEEEIKEEKKRRRKRK